MTNTNLPYPPKPTETSVSIIAPGPEFKKQVRRSVISIVFFVVVYILLFLAAIAIASVFSLLGGTILSTGLGYFGLIIGVGLIISGLSLVFFVIKFLFKWTKADYTGLTRITRENQPDLFAFIDKLTAEIGAPKPQKVFLARNVNAWVNYNSTFWSMFFPVRKNLTIGLGLVNSLNVSEFKAILAHEFGHFSQRSMKVGSYVHQLNKIIYNLLYENSGYQKLLNRWARMHGIFRALAYIDIQLIAGMQAILKKVYLTVNKAHLALSREMEYHADAIAAYSAGSNQISCALDRIEIGHICYSNLLDYLDRKLAEEQIAGNLFVLHTQALKLYGQNQGYGIDELGLPKVAGQPGKTGELIEIDDPWSTHPRKEDRKSHLQALNLETPALQVPAWSLFKDAEKLQEESTRILYSTVAVKPGVALIEAEMLTEDITAALNHHNYNELFKDYFDNRNITQFEIEITAAPAKSEIAVTFDDLLSSENCHLPKQLAILKQNTVLLDQLVANPGDAHFFFYKNKKYSLSQAGEVKLVIEKETDNIRLKIEKLDRAVFEYFFVIAGTGEAREQLTGKYSVLFGYQTEMDDDIKQCDDILQTMSPVYKKLQPGQIRNIMSDVYWKEKTVKSRLKEIISGESWKAYVSENDAKAVNLYLKNNWQYYMKPHYDNNAIRVFNNAIKAYANIATQRVYAAKKDLLDFQASLLR